MTSQQTPERFEDLPALWELREHLVGYVAAAERPDRHAVRRRRLGARRLLVALAMLVVGGSAAAAVLSPGKSRPLSGTLPAQFVGLHAPGGTQYSVRLFPFLSVGWTGWCWSLTFAVHGRTVQTSYGCRPVERADAIVVQRFSEGGRAGDYLAAIVTGRVVKVRYADGVTVRPIGDPRLPSWARAAVRVFSTREVARFEVHHRGRHASAELFTEEWFAADGRRLVEPLTFSNESAEHLALTTLNPQQPADLPCAIHASSLAGLVPVSQTVTTPAAWPRRTPGGFLACANAVYRLDGTNLAAAALVNATNPAQPAEQLPGLTDDPSHPDILRGGEVGTIGYPQGVSGGGVRTTAFETFGSHKWDLTEEHNLRDHDISAKRAGRGWLIVEGGTPSQRAALLRALKTEA
jgi:hypothetical protein